MTRADEHPLLETLSAHVDGEIAAPELPALEEHLRSCAGCRRQLDDLRILAAGSADQEIPPVPAGLAARVSARLDEDPAAPAPSSAGPAGRWRRLSPWLWRGGPLAAAAGFLGAVILWRIWVADPASVEPVKLMAPSAPAIQESRPPEPDSGVGQAVAPADQGGTRGEEDLSPPAGLQEPAAGAMPSRKLKVKGPVENDVSPPQTVPPPAEKKERGKQGGEEPMQEQRGRQDAASAGSVRGFASQDAAAPVDELLLDEDATRPEVLGEEDVAREQADDKRLEKHAVRPSAMRDEAAAGTVLLQMEESGATVSLTREGDLRVVAPGYRCRIHIDMEGVVAPEPVNETATREILLRLVSERYRADLEKQCGSLPPALAPPPQN